MAAPSVLAGYERPVLGQVVSEVYPLEKASEAMNAMAARKVLPHPTRCPPPVHVTLTASRSLHKDYWQDRARPMSQANASARATGLKDIIVSVWKGSSLGLCRSRA